LDVKADPALVGRAPFCQASRGFFALLVAFQEACLGAPFQFFAAED
jgi:hypothetical protein